MIRAPWICCLVVLLASGVSCRRPQAEKHTRIPEAYIPSSGSVPFDIQPIREHDSQWLATYTSNGKTARFRIELGKPTSSETTKGIPLQFGEGKLIAEPGSDATVFLAELKRALEAKALPVNVRRSAALRFQFVNLGDNASQLPSGGFNDNPPGNWTTLKLFFGSGKQESEVYLNLNPVIGKAEFSIKDSDYGDLLLADLAKVL